MATTQQPFTPAPVQFVEITDCTCGFADCIDCCDFDA